MKERDNYWGGAIPHFNHLEEVDILNLNNFCFLPSLKFVFSFLKTKILTNKLYTKYSLKDKNKFLPLSPIP
jgi:hypothetical protein